LASVLFYSILLCSELLVSFKYFVALYAEFSDVTTLCVAYSVCVVVH